jgi:exonuclease III
MPIHLISLNAQGLRDIEKRQRLLLWLGQQKAQIVLLQETHFTKDIEINTNLQFSNWQCYHNFGSNNSSGVSILFHKTLDINITNIYRDHNGRSILVNITLEKNEITLLNVYAHNNEKNRNELFESYLPLLNKEKQSILIIGGDFNEVLSKLDRKPTPSKLKNSNSLINLIKEFNLNDIWRTKNTNKTHFTWRRKNGIEKSRIDYWLINEDIIPLVRSCDIRPALIRYTDHMAISIKVILNNTRGPGTWKFNNSLLEDRTYISRLKTFINEYKNSHINSNKNPQVLWEILKIDIKEFTIKYSKHKKQNATQYLNILEKELKRLYIQNENKPLPQTLHDRKIFIENEIEKIYYQKAKGAIIRSRVQIIDEGEKCTKYFLNLEKSRQSRKVIHTLQVNNTLLTDRDKILKAESEFYKTLYSAKITNRLNLDSYLETIHIPALDENLSTLCDGHLTEHECYVSLNEMKLNKSPGSDGLTVEFYKQFWNILGQIIVNSLNFAYDHGKLSYSQKHSILSLIYKKGDPNNLENWRPISLLNIDYKIATRSLAKRLQRVLPNLISYDQQGYIKGRYIGYNIRQIQDILDYSELLNLDGAMLFLDFKKAFDTVDHIFMFRVIKLFGFGNSFIKWIETFYNSITTCVFNNGWKSDVIYPSRGLKQGCSLSALIYLLVAEILSIKLKMSPDFKGISIENSNGELISLKLTQLADDTTLFVNDKKDAKHALEIVSEFSKHSGLYLNRTKTECLWIGRMKNQEDDIDDIKSSKIVKALGITFGYDRKLCQENNWEKPFKECKKTILAWEKRNLSFYGRVTIIKTLLISKFVYLFHSLPVPKHVITDINKLIFKFLWKNGREKIKRKTLIGSKLVGGLNMIDIESFIKSIKMKWVKTLLQKDNSNWKIIPEKLINQYGKDFLIFYMKVRTLKELPNPFIKLTPFYTDILNIYFDFKSLESNFETFPLNYADIRKQLLWGNKHIRFNSKPLLFKKWIESDILFVNDVIGPTGRIDEEKILTKLKTKTNWISEVNILKCSIPKRWTNIIKCNESIHTQVKTELNLCFNTKRIIQMTNKDFYNAMIKHIFEKPYVQKKWENIFKNKIDWENAYLNIEKNNVDNRIKQYKFKLMHDILAIKQNLYKWKIENNPYCNVCQEIENYEHFFLKCKSIEPFLTKISNVFMQCGFNETIISIKSFVIGYKISHRSYRDVNIILNIIGFSIYKSYYQCDKRKHKICIEDTFSYELNNILNYFERKNDVSNFLRKFNKIYLDT